MCSCCGTSAPGIILTAKRLFNVEKLLRRGGARIPMGKHDVLIVKRHPDGWAVTRPNAKRASAVRDTQAEAVKKAHKMAPEGIVHIQGRHGKLRKETPYG
jgi:hypothetical protein